MSRDRQRNIPLQCAVFPLFPCWVPDTATRDRGIHLLRFPDVSYSLSLSIAMTHPYDIIVSDCEMLQSPALNIGNCLTHSLLSQSARGTCWHKWQPRQHDAQSITTTELRRSPSTSIEKSI
jgi:hypothetical protein